MKLPKAVRRAFVALGKKGGKARAAALTKEQRSAIARKGGKARWRRNGEVG